MIDRIFQVEDPILYGVADIILGIHCRRRHLLVSAAFGQLLVLQQEMDGIRFSKEDTTAEERQQYKPQQKGKNPIMQGIIES